MLTKPVCSCLILSSAVGLPSDRWTQNRGCFCSDAPEPDTRWCPWRLWFVHSWKKNHDILVWFYSIPHLNPIARANDGLVFVSAIRRYVETSHFFMFHFQSCVLTVCAYDLIRCRDKKHFSSGFGKEVWALVHLLMPPNTSCTLSRHLVENIQFYWWNVEGSQLSLQSHHHSSCC